jgi:alpha-glucosidase (family GH31 glycosyl hydrolase)
MSLRNVDLVGQTVRFTPLTAGCIRMEYAPDGRFSDAPTLFAQSRSLRYDDAVIEEIGKEISITTSHYQLTYTKDGLPFSEKTLQIKLPNGREWTPGMIDDANLRGPLPTLDSVNGPVELPPGLLSRNGWALIDDSNRPVFDGEWLQPRNDGCGEQGKTTPQDWYFFAYITENGPDYLNALQSLSAISGEFALPRKHIFGSWYCRWHRYSEYDFREIVSEYDKYQFPLDVMVMDMDWHTLTDAKVGYGHAKNLGWTGWSIDRTLLPNFEKLLHDFDDDNIKVTLNVHPHDGVRAHEECYPTFMKMLKKEPDGVTNPPFNAGNEKYMNAYFKAAHAPLENAGVDFWWVDWQQDYIYPEVPGLPGLTHLPWLNHLYYKNSQARGKRGLGFSRWGGYGDHRYPIHFSGDTRANWQTLAFEVEFTAVSSNNGCFFWAHDIGGFVGKRNPENYARWVQFGALSASLRLHSSGDDLDRRPWKWGKIFEDSMRASYSLRSTLMPYVYTSASQGYRDSQPLVRGMYMGWPNEDAAYNQPQQYQFGDHLLVAPITTPGDGERLVSSQQMWLPPGDMWCNWFTGECFQGGQTLQVECDIDNFPLFVRAGALIPMQPFSTRMTSGEISHLILKGFTPADGELVKGELYEDDGQSDGYLRGEFRITTWEALLKGKSLTVVIHPAEGSYSGMIEARNITIDIVVPHKPQRVVCNGKEQEVEYDEISSRLRLSLVSTPCSVAQTLEIDLTFEV